MQRILSLDDGHVWRIVEVVSDGLAGRHRDIDWVLMRRFKEVSDPHDSLAAVNWEQALLIGAYFTQEYSFQAAALFNPSIVVHPDQSNVPGEALRFILSLRAVGEGHTSSITFRAGLFSQASGFSLGTHLPIVGFVEKSGAQVFEQ